MYMGYYNYIKQDADVFNFVVFNESGQVEFRSFTDEFLKSQVSLCSNVVCHLCLPCYTAYMQTMACLIKNN